MKVNVGWVVFFSLLAGAIVWAYREYLWLPLKTVTIDKRRNYDLMTLKLPNSMDTEVFGKKYWESLHAIAGNIPCSMCRNDAMPMMVFMHDLVNFKLKKDIYSEKNFKRWIDKVSEINTTLKSKKIV